MSRSRYNLFINWLNRVKVYLINCSWRVRLKNVAEEVQLKNCISAVTYYNSSSCFKRKTLSYKEKIFILLNPFASSFSRKGLVIYYSQATADRSLHLHTNFTNILQPRQNIIDIEGKKSDKQKTKNQYLSFMQHNFISALSILLHFVFKYVHRTE